MKKHGIVVLILILIFIPALTGCGGGGNGATNPIPDAPGNVKATPGPNQITVAWDAVSGAAAYEVWYHTENNSGTSNRLTGDANLADTACVITGLTNGTAYYVWVKASNNSGISGFSQPAQATPQAPTVAPAAPLAPTITAGNRQLRVNWQAVEGAAAYEVWYHTENNSGTAQKFGSDITGLNCTITNLTNGTTYYVWVRAKNSEGTSGFSPGASGRPVDVSSTGAIIIDHTCTYLNRIPVTYINQAKANLCIAYGHTSHGSQLSNGMSGLVNWVHGGSLYSWNGSGSGGALELHDYYGNFGGSGASDLGNPNRTAWATATRTYLGNHPETNVIIWSWCGQVGGTSEEINTYLNLMSDLEEDFPGVKFVYMTGHLDGTGIGGNVNQRNEQIRNYCRTNNKILYDFADIESYDPDGLVNYMALNANDGCNYDSNNNGSRDRNWATVWQTAHPGEWYECTSDGHTQPLNANRKAYAAWWLWARLAGWDGN